MVEKAIYWIDRMNRMDRRRRINKPGSRRQI
jgi:hypothetical protein